MSYLLTEIALEMLGYKFYDTNGVFHLTNFQQSPEATQADIHPDEPSLLEFIDQPDDIETEKNDIDPSQLVNRKAMSSPSSTSSQTSPSSSMAVDFRRTPVRALAKIVEKESDNKKRQSQTGEQHLKISDAPVVPVAISKTSTSIRRTPAKALAKIVEYESCNIRTQFKQQLESAFKDVKREHVEDMLCDKKVKLAEDANVLYKFRQYLEERLRRIDSRPYETYKRTFHAD